MANFKRFTATDATELTLQAKAGVFISTGKVIDIIRATARKGETCVRIVGLPKSTAEVLANKHGFTVVEDYVSWPSDHLETETKEE